MRDHLWSQVGAWSLVELVVVCIALVGFMLWLTWTVAVRLGFDRGDALAIQFCGTKQSMATGLPMATVLFAGMPDLALVVLPLMIFHQVQLMACGALAGRYARALEQAMGASVRPLMPGVRPRPGTAEEDPDIEPPAGEQGPHR